MYKTGSVDRTALDLFDGFTKGIRNPPQIYQAEAEFISKGKNGPLVFCNPYTGPGYKYDIISSYPSIMSSGCLFPIDEGEFKHLSKDEFDNLPFYQYVVV